MAREISIVLVGLGGYGNHYLAELLDAPPEWGARFVAGVDPSPQGCQRLVELEERGIPVYPDLAAFYQRHSAELAVIAAPIHLHAPLTRLALDHGSNVLCEKPLAATVHEARTMAEAQERAGKFVAVGYQWSFSRAIQHLKHDVQAGYFGRPLRFKTLVSWPRGLSYYRRAPWAGRQRMPDGSWVLDSPVNNAAAHYLHNMLYILGKARNESAQLVEVRAEIYRANEIENYDTAALGCRTSEGVDLLFYASHAVPSRIGPLAAYEFERALVYNESTDSPQFIARFRDGRMQRYAQSDATDCDKLWQAVEAVRTGRPVACGIEAAMSHTVCVQAAQASTPEIVDLPKDRLRVTERGDGPLVWVDGLQDVLVQCYDQGILPAEHGSVAWARRGRPVRIVNGVLSPS